MTKQLTLEDLEKASADIEKAGIPEGVVGCYDGVGNFSSSKLQKQRELFKGYSPEKLGKFRAYHHKHPHIYKLFIQYSLAMYKTGRKKYGSMFIINKIRRDQDFDYPDREFKICNDYAPMYARLAIRDYPQLASFFVIKGVYS